MSQLQITENNRNQTTWKSEYPFFAAEKERLYSFDNWPKSIKQDPTQLSEAGHIYTQKDDEVICFMCGGGLNNWEEIDNPWEARTLFWRL